MWISKRLVLATTLGVAGACHFDPSGLTGSRDGGLVPSDARDHAVENDAAADAQAGGVDARPGIDAGSIDAAGPCPGAAIPFSPTNVSRCALAAPLGPLTISPGLWTLDTDTGVLRADLGGTTIPLPAITIAQPGAPSITAVTVETLRVELGAAVRLRGDNALVIAVLGDALIAGTVEASAGAQQAGPGGDHAEACASGFGADGALDTSIFGVSGGTGGGGGAYRGAGGIGGPISDGFATVPAGSASGATSLAPLRGGCGGGAGGAGGRPGGAGGGAVQLIVAGTLEVGVTGQVAAAGAGGLGATTTSAGGSGGGAGGAILLEASALVVNGKLTAHGGGGGEGKRTFFDGADGESGRTGDDAAAAGGVGLSDGGDGGVGGTGSAPGDGGAGDGDEDEVGGGGGGGGSGGRIRLRSVQPLEISFTALVSPPP